MLTYEVGDIVIHSVFGRGKVVAISDKGSLDAPLLYYIIEPGSEPLWVPVAAEGSNSLHLLTSTADFQLLLSLLHSQAEKLSTDPRYRQRQLVERMQKGTPRDICLVLRDLTHFSRTRKLNREDVRTMNRAKLYMLTEWQQSLGISREKANTGLKWTLYELQYYS